MMFRKVAGPIRVDAFNTTVTWYPLTSQGGGRMCKVVNYQVKVLQTSGSTARISVRLDHGPDGNTFLPHSTPINVVPPGSTFPVIVNGDAGSGIVGEYLLPLLGASSSDANPSWMVVEIYEMRKPF